MNKSEFCSKIDYSAVSQYNSQEEIERKCQDVLRYGFACICCQPSDVSFAKSIIGDKASVGGVVGFPMGANSIDIKVQEAIEAIENGANELDVVMNISKFKDGSYDYVLEELKQIVKAAKNQKSDCIIKVIIETPHLKDLDELTKACELVIASGADYVKQCTGFATENDGTPISFENTDIDNVKAIHDIVNERIKIKTSGDPKNLDECVYYIQEWGVSRIGNDNIGDWLDEAGDDYWKDK